MPGVLTVALGDVVAFRAAALPPAAFSGGEGLGVDGDFVRHHKGGVEPNAELADDVHVLLAAVLLFEVQGAALGDGAQVVFQLFRRHADAVVFNGNGSGVFVVGQMDEQLFRLAGVVGELDEMPLVQSIAGVGNQLPQENLLVGIDGIDHHIQQLFGFCFKFFGCHKE